MSDILIHHGILGQKWGVRRFQNSDGSLTKAGKDRYGVGTRNGTTRGIGVGSTSEHIEKFKNLYKKALEGSKKTLSAINQSPDPKALEKYVDRMKDLITNETITYRQQLELYDIVGIDYIDRSDFLSLYEKLLPKAYEGDREAIDDLTKYAMLVSAYRDMGLVNWLPSDVDKDEEMMKTMQEMQKNIDKYGLSDIIKIDNINGELMYIYIPPNAEWGQEGPIGAVRFDKDDMKGLREYVLKNDLLLKDFRKSSNARTREKNIDASGGSKVIKKREPINVSDAERLEKELNSKKTEQERVAKNKEMLDQLIYAQARTKASIKQDDAKKEGELKKQRALAEKRTQAAIKQDAARKKEEKRKKLKHSESFTTHEILIHHGILNQRWGVRNGPPYPLGGGDYSPSEKKAIKGQRRMGNSIYNKKHFDEILRKDKTTLSTLSYDQNRTKNTDMFYATHDIWDKHQYNALFNRKMPKTLYDDSGAPIGTGTFLKFRIDNSLKSDIKVASEDSGAKIFKNLYKKDRDFYNFVTDPSRMEDYFVKDKYKFKGYQEAGNVLKKMRSNNYNPTEDDVHTLYRMFNYVIPYDGQGNSRKGGDVTKQRAKFFKELKDAGYGAVLDTNDAIYGGFKAKSPVIVFDMEQIIPKEVYQTTMNDKAVSEAALVLRKLLRQ